VSFAMEPKDKIKAGGFTGRSTDLLDRVNLLRVFLMGSVMTLGTLFVFIKFLPASGGFDSLDLIKAQTMALTTLAVFQWFNAWNCRSRDKSIFMTNPFSNIYLLLSTVIVILLHAAILYIPFLQKIFSTTGLTATEWVGILIICSSVILVEEVRKVAFKFMK